MAKRDVTRSSKEGDSLAAIGRTLRVHGYVLVIFLGLMWAEEIIDVFMGGRLDAFGIRPRTVEGLVGIFLAPFLHGGFGHLIANTPFFLLLGWLVLARETWHFFAVSLGVTILGGLGVWLVGAGNSVHIGASGMIFGYLGYLMLGGFFERRLVTMFGSVVVAFLFGGLLWQVLPGIPGVSWEGHLFGFLGGVVMAWALAQRSGKKARLQKKSA